MSRSNEDYFLFRANYKSASVRLREISLHIMGRGVLSQRLRSRARIRCLPGTIQPLLALERSMSERVKRRQKREAHARHLLLHCVVNFLEKANFTPIARVFQCEGDKLCVRMRETANEKLRHLNIFAWLALRGGLPTCRDIS